MIIRRIADLTGIGLDGIGGLSVCNYGEGAALKVRHYIAVVNRLFKLTGNFIEELIRADNTRTLFNVAEVIELNQQYSGITFAFNGLADCAGHAVHKELAVIQAGDRIGLAEQGQLFFQLLAVALGADNYLDAGLAINAGIGKLHFTHKFSAIGIFQVQLQLAFLLVTEVLVFT